MSWPSNSPDLDPIENVWGIMKKNIEKRNPQTTAQLKQIVLKEWDAIDKDDLKALVGSTKPRCEEVFQRNGFTIDY